MFGHPRIKLMICTLCIISCSSQQSSSIEIDDLFPWCIVAYDSIERKPIDRIKMIKELGFTNYAYDWRDKHLDDMESEIELTIQEEVQVIAVWLWLNAKRDSLNSLSPANKRVLEIVNKTDLETTFWVSFNNNFFEGQTQQESMKTATEFIRMIHHQVKPMGCDIALYNHSGWFSNLDNQIEIINKLPDYNLSMVFNFHHANNYIDNFDEIASTIAPHLSAVNTNGVSKEGPKILPVGKGDHEFEMIESLMKEGFSGPWGILGHVEGVDVREILEENIEGLISMKLLNEDERNKDY